MRGERLSELVSPERLKLAAALVLLSPFTPLLFMGEEYGETAPFQYFASHSDKDLVEAVRKGRKEEFPEFFASGQAPDPFDPRTFQQCKLNPQLRAKAVHQEVYDFYRKLIACRRRNSCFTHAERHHIEVLVHDSVLQVSYDCPGEAQVTILFNFSSQPALFPKNLQGRKPSLTSSGDAQMLTPWAASVFEGA